MSKVSVLLTFYSEDPLFFIKAVESILCQTYTDFQFVIVSDNPYNEKLNALAESYALKDKRIRFVKNSVNLGLTRSLNVGLQYCEGDFIARMDADDLAMPNRLEKQVSYMNDNPEIIASGTNAYVIDENDIVIGKMERPRSNKELVSLAPFVSPLFHPASIIKREFSGECLKYNEKYRYSQDYDLWNNLIYKGKIGNLPDYLIKYRKSRNQISSVHREEQKKIDAEIMANSIEKLFKGIDKEQVNTLVLLCDYSNGRSSLKYSEAENALYSLYKGNLSDDRVDIKIPINYLVKNYCILLSNNFSYLFSIKRIFLLNKELNIGSISKIILLSKLYLSKFIKKHPSLYKLNRLCYLCFLNIKKNVR